MTTKDITQLHAEICKPLSPLSSEERSRVIQATLILLGETQVSAPNPTPTHPHSSPHHQPTLHKPNQNIQAFLSEKDPKNKGEILACLARYRELNESIEEHSKQDFKTLSAAARRNFDDKNFKRDIENAKRQSGFFNTGSGRDSHKLSYYGQQYVDVLPNREEAVKLKRPKKSSAKKKAPKK